MINRIWDNSEELSGITDCLISNTQEPMCTFDAGFRLFFIFDSRGNPSLIPYFEMKNQYFTVRAMRDPGQILCRDFYSENEKKSSEIILAVEKETDVETARDLGFKAIRYPRNDDYWDDEFSRSATDVVFIPSLTERGTGLAEVAINKTVGIAAKLRMVSLVPADYGDDLTSWVTAGGNPEQLRMLINDSENIP